MSLDKKKCVPCEGGIKALTSEQAKELQKNTPEWMISDKATSIVRTFKFKNFKESLGFVNKVGEVAEEQGHHPDFSFGWGYCHVVLMTHSIDGLHKNDFIMAAKIDELVK
jgi:4a-hydroxytetrahydrobiopterin dehydratase